MEITLKEQKRRDYILNQPVFKVLIMIAYPIVIYNFITFCYSFIDAFMVSSIDKTSVSAVFFFNQLNNVIKAIGLGLCTGGGVILARYYGSGDFEKAKKTSNIVFYGLSIITAVIVFLAIVLTPLIFKISNTSEALSQAGYYYFIIQVLTIFFTTITSLYFAYERANGNTKNILIINVISMIVKISLTAIVVYVMQEGLTYVAIATMISHCVTFIIAIVNMCRKDYVFRITLSGIKYLKNIDIVKEVLAISVPLVVSKLIFTIGKFSVSSLGVKYYDEDVVAALGLASTASELATFVAVALEDSIGSLVSQNIGAKNEARAREMIRKSVISVIVITSVSIIILQIFKNDVLYLFVKNEDLEYQKLVSQVFSYEVFSSLTSGIGAVLLGALNGYGYTKPTIYANLARLFIFRIPVFILLAKVLEMPPYSIGITMFVSNFMYMVSAIIVYIIYKKSNKYKELLKGMEA